MNEPASPARWAAVGQLAVGNFLLHRRRSLIATLGVGLALLLVFIQLGVLSAARRQTTSLYDLFAFDLAVVSADLQFLFAAPSFNATRLSAVRTHPDVARVEALDVNHANWVNLETETRMPMMLIGLSSDSELLSAPGLIPQLPKLKSARSVLVDRMSSPDFGNPGLGDTVDIDGESLQVAGLFSLGMFFVADGAAIVNPGSFRRLTRRPADRVNFGLVRLQAGANAEQVAKALATALPDDVLVMTRQALRDKEQTYFVSVKPVGILFQIGVLIAFLVGAIIQFQITSIDVRNHLPESAVLRAMGVPHKIVFAIAALQALILTAASLLPAIALAWVGFKAASPLLRLPLQLDSGILLNAFALAGAMCLFAVSVGLLPLRRIDPAELA